MDRTAIFVDAGYLFAAGSKLIANEKLPRGQLSLDNDAVLKRLADLAIELTGLPLLRIYMVRRHIDWSHTTAVGPRVSTERKAPIGFREPARRTEGC